MLINFQKDNVANQREHLILLLANVHIRQFPKPEQQPKVCIWHRYLVDTLCYFSSPDKAFNVNGYFLSSLSKLPSMNHFESASICIASCPEYNQAYCVFAYSKK